MNRGRLHAALAASALALPLGGCVAAAIPIVAGGSILSVTEGTRKRPAPAPAQPAAEPDAPGGNASRLVIVPGVLPPPSGTAGVGAYTAFLDYARTEAVRHPADELRTSAVLADPGSLDPATTDCAILPPAVLVDLDPGDATLDIDTLAPDAALAAGLAELRLMGAEVFWISTASAGEAGTLRNRLRATGLDADGRDGLLLMRRAEDRKQLRREELAETHCVVAIAGDARSDFDELFDYLQNPDAAVQLESLFGSGWFLLDPTPANEASQ